MGYEDWLAENGLESIHKVLSAAQLRQRRAAARSSAEARAYQEEAGSAFTHQGKRYDLNTVLRSTANRPTRRTSTRRLAWVLDHDTPQPERVQRADTSSPLLVARTRTGRSVVVDGLHRLARAQRDGQRKVPTRRVKRSDLRRARS